LADVDGPAEPALCAALALCVTLAAGAADGVDWCVGAVLGVLDGVAEVDRVGEGVFDGVGVAVPPVVPEPVGVGDPGVGDACVGVGCPVGPVGGVVAGAPGAGTGAKMRVAPKNRDHVTDDTFTTSPVVGAWTMRPPPM